MARPKRICSAEGCARPHLAKGFCTLHYQRNKNGVDFSLHIRGIRADMEEFVEAAIASNTDECIDWPWSKSRGYAMWYVGDRKEVVTHEVCRRAHGPQPSPQHVAAHSCNRGKFGCINQKHLRWATEVENAHDKHIHGTQPLGERLPWSKLTADDIKIIRTMTGSQAEIGRIFGVRQATISDVIHRRTWKHI